MASPQLEYRDSGPLNKTFSASPQPSPLVRRIDASRLPGRLARTLKCFVVVSKQGPDFWAPTFAVSVESNVSYRTVQRHFDELERRNVLKLKHPANSFVGNAVRRPATYVLHPEAGKQLAPRESYFEWKNRNRRSAPPRFRPDRATHSIHHAAAPDSAPESSQPAVPPTNPSCRTTPGSRAEERVQKLRQALGRSMAQLMRGMTRTRPPEGGMGSMLEPGDQGYSPPMSREEALVEACTSLGITPEEGAEHLNLMRWKFADEKEQGP